MQKKITVIVLVIMVISLLGNLLRYKMRNIGFESLSREDQNMLKQIAQIYEEAREDVAEGNKLEEVTLLVSKEEEESSRYCYVIGKTKAFYHFLGSKVSIPSEINIPCVFQISRFFKSPLWTWMSSGFVLVDVGSDYTFFYQV